jgi:hypothetical protein
VAKGTPPPGSSNYSIHGSPFQLIIGKGLVHQRLAASAAEADALDLIVVSAATAFPAKGVEVGDGCSEYKIEIRKFPTTEVITIGPWQPPGSSIFGFTETADPHRK